MSCPAPGRVALAAITLLAGLSAVRAQEHGTAFALLRTPDAIYVAADSKLSWIDTTGAPGSICKIRRVGSTWYVMGGIYKYPASGYDAPALAKLALGSRASVAEKARDFETRAINPVQKLLDSISGREAQLESWEEVASIPLTIFIFGFEQGGAAVSSREFEHSGSGDKATVRIRRRDYGPLTGEVVWMASPSSISGEFVAAHPSWQTMEPSSMVRTFVEFAIRKRPETTGSPIDVLKLEKDGHRWLRRKTDCMD